jgi:hypothetical protein
MHPEGYEQVWAELPTLLFISLSKGKFTVIDGCDWPIVAGVPLYAGGKPGSWYATATGASMWRLSRRMDELATSELLAPSRKPQRLTTSPPSRTSVSSPT